MTQELEHRRRRLDYVPIGTRTVLIPIPSEECTYDFLPSTTNSSKLDPHAHFS